MKKKKTKNPFEEIAEVLDDCMYEAAPYRYIELSGIGLSCIFTYREGLMKFIIERFENAKYIDALIINNFGEKFLIYRNSNLINIGVLKIIDGFLNYSLRKEIHLTR